MRFQKFERGDVTQIVEHCVFYAKHRIALPLNAANRIASAVQVVDNRYEWDCFSWDVYRFRNATNGEWLTACVGAATCCSSCHIVHLLKGEAFPHATFALLH